MSKESLESYRQDFVGWLGKNKSKKFLGHFCHFAIKVENEKALYEVVEDIRPFCVNRIDNTPGLSVRKMHGRKIAVALLSTPIEFEDQQINCIEIMQPRPEVEGKDVIGIDHLEIINPNHDEIEKSFRDTEAGYYIDETNPYKEIIVSFVNNKRQRVKFTNNTLETIVPIQIEDEPERVEILLR